MRALPQEEEKKKKSPEELRRARGFVPTVDLWPRVTGWRLVHWSRLEGPAPPKTRRRPLVMTGTNTELS